MSPRPPALGWHDLRVEAGLTIRALERALEELTGINRGELSRIERGSAVPRPDQALRLLEAYGFVLVTQRGESFVLRPAGRSASSPAEPA